jgi:uncharacterized RDD family membrane protein YckC
MTYYIKRLLAFIIDFFICAVVFILYVNFFYTKTGVRFYSAKGHYPLLEWGLLISLYYFFQELLWHKTIGKYIFSLKVEKIDGSKLTVTDLLKRHLFDAIENLLFPGLLFAILELTKGKHQKLGDLLANTTVSNTKRN